MNLHATPTRDEFEARLRAIGDELYHDKHPFHHMLHSGKCYMEQVQGWVINRYYYQTRIPMKDAAFMSRVNDPALRFGAGELGHAGRQPHQSRECGARTRRRLSRRASASTTSNSMPRT